MDEHQANHAGHLINARRVVLPALVQFGPFVPGDFGLDDDENETYVKADVHLRETLRVVSDAIKLGREQPEKWAHNRLPLTVGAGG